MKAAGVDFDAAYTYPNDLVDFEVSDQSHGAAYRVLIPLQQPLATGAVYHHYGGSEVGWQTFVENATNQLWSAPGVGGACPDMFSTDYIEGLTIGDQCLLLIVEDGGPNDTDGLADGVLTALGGIAISMGPDASQTSVVLSKNTIIANGLDRVTITVTVAAANGLPLEGLTVAIADCEHCDRIIILPFTDRGEGIYDSALVRWDPIQGGVDRLYFSVTDGINTIQLGPVELSVVAPLDQMVVARWGIANRPTARCYCCCY